MTRNNVLIFTSVFPIYEDDINPNQMKVKIGSKIQGFKPL